MPKAVKSTFQVLNDFQSSKSLALGKDYSFDYAGSRNMMLYILDENDRGGNSSSSLISFKCFLESFSIKLGVKVDEEEGDSGNTINMKDFESDFVIKLNVPAISVNDSRVNLGRLEEVVQMCLAGYTFGENGDLITGPGPKRVLFANMIHNGKYKKFHQITNKSIVRKYGMRCYFANASFQVDVESGFFEYKSKLFPKAYSLDLNLDISFEQDGAMGDKRYLCGFNDDGDYDDEDIKTWPFGVS